MHECAHAISQATVQVFEGLLREDEHGDAFGEVYEWVRMGLEMYEVDRMQRWVTPSRN
jgi:hypothetical protein